MPVGLFQDGTNTLTFVVINSDGVGGFNVSNLLLTGSAVPEPSSGIMALFAFAAGGATYLIRRGGAEPVVVGRAVACDSSSRRDQGTAVRLSPTGES